MMHATAHTFLAGLTESQLLLPDQMASAQAELAQAGDLPPQELARRLVESGRLTRWQAEMLLAGRTAFFLGKYKLLRELGRGGMGAVFQAEQTQLGRIVAVKVMAQKLVQDERAVTRFHREIQAAASLTHPNIVTALDADQVGQTHLLVMEYVEGESFDTVLKRETRLPPPVACEYVRQAALGLQHAHEQGLAHRDIKPSNLLLTRSADGDPVVKILDFGLARFTSECHDQGELTATGEVVGTPDYIAPEQAHSTKSADIRSDIFSLGCTLFRMLTGRVPFGGENVMAKLMARAMHDAPRLRSVDPAIPQALDDVVAKMLARDPTHRYQTPTEVIAALAPWTGSNSRAPLPSTRPGSSSEAWPKPRDVTSGLDFLLQELDTRPADEQITAPFGRASDAASTIVSGSHAKSLNVSSRQQTGTKWRQALLAVAAGGVSLALAFGFVVWSMTARTTLTLDWPEGERAQATLEVDGRPQRVPAEGPLQFPGAVGRRTVKLTRPGYEPLQATWTLSRGAAQVFQPKWKPTAATRRKEAFAVLQAEAVNTLKALTALPEKLDPKLIDLRRRLAEFDRLWSGTSEALEVRQSLARLPSPLDLLSREQIPAADLKAVGLGVASRAPASLVAVYGTGRLKHWNVARSIAVSPDGKTLYSAGDDWTVRSWSRETGELLHVLDDTWSGAARLFATESSILFPGFSAGSTDYSVRTLDLRGGRPPVELSTRDLPVRAAAWNAKSRRFAIAGERTVRIWNLDTGTELASVTPHSASVQDIAFSPDGEWIASGGDDGFVRVWNATTGEERFARQVTDHTVGGVAFSHDGRWIAAGGVTHDNHYPLTMWSFESGQKLYAAPDSCIGALRFSPDDHYLAGACPDNSVAVLDAQSGAGIARFQLAGMTTDIAFAADGRAVVISSSDGSVSLWNRETGQRLLAPAAGDHARSAIRAAVSSDGLRLISIGSEGSVVSRSLPSGEILKVVEDPGDVFHADISPDGRLAAFGSPVHVWEIEMGLLKFVEPEMAHKARYPRFARNGQWLAIGANEKVALQVHDLKTSKPLLVVPGWTDVATAAISPDGTMALTATYEGVQVWAVPSGEKLRTLNVPGPAALAISPDGRTAATFGDGYQVTIWDTETWTSTGHIADQDALQTVVSMAFHPDGHLLACAASGSGAVTLVDVAKAEILETIPIASHGSYIHNVVFSPDGRHLVTSNANGTVYVLRIKAWSANENDL